MAGVVGCRVPNTGPVSAGRHTGGGVEQSGGGRRAGEEGGEVGQSGGSGGGCGENSWRVYEGWCRVAGGCDSRGEQSNINCNDNIAPVGRR